MAIGVAHAASPARVGWDEERRNLIGPAPVIRTNESGRSFQSVEIELVIDTNGRVRSAQALDLPQFAERALTIAKALRFRPFLRSGVPVEVRAEEHVFILPPEKLPANHVPFPAVEDLSSVEFSLERTYCFGSCPSYSVRITGDGAVEYSGRGSVAVEGQHSDRITFEKVRRLLDAFRKADFYSFDDKYSLFVTDNPTYVVGIKIGTIAKTITDYVGTQAGMPQVISTLEDEVDASAGTAKWLRGNSESCASLRKEGFDFKSRAAGEMLSRVAASGDESVVRELIDAGAPVSIPDMLGVTALANAAGSGKREAVELLIRHGANAKDPRVLMEAARSGSPSVVGRILQAGANPKADLPEIRFLLFTAVTERREISEDPDRGAVVRLLVKAGVDPNGRDEYGNTPLHDSLQDEDATRALIDAGADINARNKNGETPLMWAFSQRVAEILLKAGADLSLRSDSGKTALDYARDRKRDQIAALLEKVAAR